MKKQDGKSVFDQLGWARVVKNADDKWVLELEELKDGKPDFELSPFDAEGEPQYNFTGLTTSGKARKVNGSSPIACPR